AGRAPAKGKTASGLISRPIFMDLLMICRASSGTRLSSSTQVMRRFRRETRYQTDRAPPGWVSERFVQDNAEPSHIPIIRMRDFRPKFRTALRLVLQCRLAAKVDIDRHGMRLFESPLS